MTTLHNVCVDGARISYFHSDNEPYYPFDHAPDIHHCEAAKLAALNLVSGVKPAGPLPDAASAVSAAATMLAAVYHKDITDEMPYAVFLNEIANAWVIHGSLEQPASGVPRLGGVTEIALDKETGAVLMLFHTQ